MLYMQIRAELLLANRCYEMAMDGIRQMAESAPGNPLVALVLCEEMAALDSAHGQNIANITQAAWN